MSPVLDTLLSYALTYLLHSTILIGLAAAIVRFLKPRSNPVREALWTVALFGGLGTAAVQLAGVGSATPTLDLRAPPSVVADSDVARSPNGTSSSSLVEAPSSSSSSSSPSYPKLRDRYVEGQPLVDPTWGGSILGAKPLPADQARTAEQPLRAPLKFVTPESNRREAPNRRLATSKNPDAGEPRTMDARRDGPGDPAAANGRVEGVALAEGSASRVLGAIAAFGRAVAARARSGIGGVLALCALLGASWFAFMMLRSKRALSDREPIEAGPLHERLESLRRRLGVTDAIALSWSDSIATPVAFGLVRFEICLPRRCVELESDQQDAMLAHEIAHLVRRDPLRLLLARAIECVGFFQPLHRYARRRLFDVVESRCDAFAVERLGDGLALAGCLAEVASWLHDRTASSLAPAMAETRSNLTTRIECLLDTDGVIASEHRRRWLAPTVLVLLPAVALVAPGVAVGAAPRVRAPETSVVGNLEIEARVPDPKFLTHEVAPFAKESGEVEAEGDAKVDAALAEVLVKLDHEMEALSSEIAGLREALLANGRVDFADSLGALEGRLSRLDQKRQAVHSVWLRMREVALEVDEAPDETALPETRRKP